MLNERAHVNKKNQFLRNATLLTLLLPCLIQFPLYFSDSPLIDLSCSHKKLN